MDGSRNWLTVQHIDKLGHEIAEIRSRALNIIDTKYTLNLVDEDNVYQCQLLFDKLMSLFNFEEAFHLEKAVGLIYKVAQSKHFPEIVKKMQAVNILQRIADIEVKAGSKCLTKLSEIKDLVLNAKRSFGCSETTNILLRSGNGFTERNYAPENYESLANLADNNLTKNNVDAVQLAQIKNSSDYQREIISEAQKPQDQSANNISSVNAHGDLKNVPKISTMEFLPWQPLISSDRQVLLLKYENLRHLNKTPLILETSLFIKDVIFRDVPSEVFLQRPLILRTILELIEKNGETRGAVLETFLEYSKHLRIRINALKDPCLRGRRWEPEIGMKILHDSTMDEKDSAHLKNVQMSIPEFCHYALKQMLSALCNPNSSEQRNILLAIVTELTEILSAVNDNSKSVANLFETCLVFWEKRNRLVFLKLLSLMLSRLFSPHHLSTSLRSMVLNCVTDPAIILFFPNFHEAILPLARMHPDYEAEKAIKLYEDSIQICLALNCAKNISKDLPSINRLENFNGLILSLEFHRNYQIVKDFFIFCSTDDNANVDVSLRKSIILKLLILADKDVRRSVYLELHKIVLKLSTSQSCGDRLGFLYDADIWKEILCHGLNAADIEIHRLSEKIIIMLLKSDNCTSAKVIARHLSTIRQCMSLLCTFAASQSALGRCILELLEPKKAEAAGLNPADFLFGNLRLLFLKNVEINEEAFARLCWLLAVNDPREEKQPTIRNIKGLHLSSVCVSIKPETPTSSSVPNFSTSGALNDLIIRLKSTSSDSNSRLKAVEQLERTLEDRTLQKDFLTDGGLLLLSNILNSALTEADNLHHPAAVKPIIKILHILVSCHPQVRESVASQPFLVSNILRSLLLFTADYAFRQHAVCLLFLLLFADLIREENSGYMNSVPKVFIPDTVVRNVHIPIAVATYVIRKIQPLPSLREHLMKDANASRLLRTYWNVLWMGDLPTLLTLTEADLAQNIFSHGLPADMRTTADDLIYLRKNWLRGELRRNMQSSEMAATGRGVEEALNEAQCAISLYEALQRMPSVANHPLLSYVPDDLESLPWAAGFGRILHMVPCNEEEESLLLNVVQFLRALVRSIGSLELLQWITGLLVDPSGIFIKLLRTMETAHPVQSRNLRHSVIFLAEEIIAKMSFNSDFAPWFLFLIVIRDYLDTYCSTHLDCFSSLLVHVTGGWNWNYSGQEELYGNLVMRVMEVVISYKSVDNPEDSFMGCNIVNNALISLGHLLHDGRASLKGWEQLWLKSLQLALRVEDEYDADYSWLIYLAHNRDTLTRAATLTLIAQMLASTRAFQMLVGTSYGTKMIWDIGLYIVVDERECGLVKEKAAALLDQLTNLGSGTDSSSFLEFFPNKRIYDRIGEIVAQLELDSCCYSDCDKLEKSTPTASMITALSKWLFSVIMLDQSTVAGHIAETNLIPSLIAVLQPGPGSEWLIMLTSVLKLIRACVHSCPRGLSILISSPKNLQNLLILLEKQGLDEDALLAKMQSECMQLLATAMTTQCGCDVMQSAISCSGDITNALVTIHRAVGNAVARKAALNLVNNIAAADMEIFFSTKLPNGLFAEEICELLLTLELPTACQALSNIMKISAPARQLALRTDLPSAIVNGIHQIKEKLNGYNVEHLYRRSTKKEVTPIIWELSFLYQLVGNICLEGERARFCFGHLADAVHKLWAWSLAMPALLSTTLQMLCTFSNGSEQASQSLALTSAPTCHKTTLIHSVKDLAKAEMEKAANADDLTTLNLALQLLCQSCVALECRVALTSGAVLEPFAKLLPTSGKRRVFRHEVYGLWLSFLNTFTCYTEGQVAVCRDPATMELLQLLAQGSDENFATLSMSILMHLTFNPMNKCRLLTNPAALLNMLLAALSSSRPAEVRLAAAILWSLAANSQKAKMLLKRAGCPSAIERARATMTEPDCVQVLDRALQVMGRSK